MPDAPLTRWPTLADRRIRLTVLGGYLGSGKTTWLRHHLFGATVAPHVLVNEAAAVPVDDHLLARAAGVTVLAGGCACCTGRAGLVAALRALCDRRSGGAAVETVVLETSGLADPAAIVAAIRDDPVLVHHLVVAEVIVLVDALYGLAQLAEDPLGARQVAAADRLIVTKGDAAAPAALADLVATLRMANPVAQLSAAVQGVACALPALGKGRPVALAGNGVASVQAMSLPLVTPVDWPALSLWLSALLAARGDDLVRVKGVIATPAGRLLVQAVRRTVQAPEVLPDGAAEGDDTLVFLGRGCTGEQLALSCRRFGVAV